MSEKPITLCEAQLEAFMARCALESLKARTTLANDDPPVFIQSVEDDLADLEAALKTLRAYVTQQDPDGEIGLFSRRKAAENNKPTP
jgi:hypothetical protein